MLKVLISVPLLKDSPGFLSTYLKVPGDAMIISEGVFLYFKVLLIAEFCCKGYHAFNIHVKILLFFVVSVAKGLVL